MTLAGSRERDEVAAAVVGVALAGDHDHRELAVIWSPLGILRAPSKLVVRGRLVRR